MSQLFQIKSRVLSLVFVVLYNLMVLEWTSIGYATDMMIIDCMNSIMLNTSIPMHRTILEFSYYLVFGELHVNL